MIRPHWTPPRKFGQLSEGKVPLQSVPDEAPVMCNAHGGFVACGARAVRHGVGEHYDSHDVMICTLKSPHHLHCATVADWAGTYEVLWKHPDDMCNPHLLPDVGFTAPAHITKTQRTDEPYMHTPPGIDFFGYYGAAA